MKIRITLFLSAFLLLSLTGCSQIISDAANETEKLPPPVQTPEEGDKPEPIDPGPEPVSTGVDAYGFTLWPEGNYLADARFDTDEYLPDFDVDASFIYRARGSMCSTVTSPED